MKQRIKNEHVRQALFFAGKPFFYFCIILMLIYLYHYKNVQGGTFIYNEFRRNVHERGKYCASH